MVHVKKNKDVGFYYGMWVGECDYCFENWRYWYFGATLGYGLEHLRRCERYRTNGVAMDNTTSLSRLLAG